MEQCMRLLFAAQWKYQTLNLGVLFDGMAASERTAAPRGARAHRLCHQTFFDYRLKTQKRRERFWTALAGPEGIFARMAKTKKPALSRFNG
jgi:hypothetical protein